MFHWLFFVVMPAQILSSQENETQVLITVQHGQSMLKLEEHLQDELNSAGRLAAGQQLDVRES